MSQTQNLEVAQSFLAGLARDDAPENVASLFTENVEWDIDGDVGALPWIGHKTGRAAVIEFIRDGGQLLERQKFDVLDMLASDTRGGHPWRICFKDKVDWKSVETAFVIVLTISEGMLREKGIVRLPVGNGRHAPIASEDIGRVAAALLESPAQHAGQTYPLFGSVEMNHEQMAAELTIALGRPISFQNPSIDEYCTSLEALGIPEYVVQHFRGAMDDYQNGVMSGMNDNVERLSGQKPMSVTEFAKRHLNELNPKSTA
jgi:hypothetical protein